MFLRGLIWKFSCSILLVLLKDSVLDSFTIELFLMIASHKWCVKVLMHGTWYKALSSLNNRSVIMS